MRNWFLRILRVFGRLRRAKRGVSLATFLAMPLTLLKAWWVIDVRQRPFDQWFLARRAKTTDEMKLGDLAIAWGPFFWFARKRRCLFLSWAVFQMSADAAMNFHLSRFTKGSRYYPYLHAFLTKGERQVFDFGGYANECDEIARYPR